MSQDARIWARKDAVVESKARSGALGSFATGPPPPPVPGSISDRPPLQPCSSSCPSQAAVYGFTLQRLMHSPALHRTPGSPAIPPTTDKATGEAKPTRAGGYVTYRPRHPSYKKTVPRLCHPTQPLHEWHACSPLHRAFSSGPRRRGKTRIYSHDRIPHRVTVLEELEACLACPKVSTKMDGTAVGRELVRKHLPLNARLLTMPLHTQYACSDFTLTYDCPIFPPVRHQKAPRQSVN